MNKLQLPQAKLFYVVGEAYRKRMIDETEKRLLKGIQRKTQKKLSQIMYKYSNVCNRVKLSQY
jgi:hypothetical protein